MKQSETKKRTLNDVIVGFGNRIIDAVLRLLHLTAYKEQILYLVVGGGTTVVDWIVFTALVFLLPEALLHLPVFPTAIPYTLGWTASVLFSYWASKYFVFENAEKKSAGQFFRFVSTRLLTLALSLGGDALLTGLLLMNEFLAKVIVSVVVIVVNYITSKFFVFIKKEEAHDKE